jgi:hypothetical protein
VATRLKEGVNGRVAARKLWGASMMVEGYSIEARGAGFALCQLSGES